jgi:integrase
VPKRPKRDSGTGSIRKLPSGKYQARVWDAATERQVSLGTFPDITTARRRLNAAMADRTSNRAVAAMPLAEWVANWYAARAPRLAPSTQHAYRRSMGFVIDGLGATAVGDLRASAVEAWYSEMLATRGRSDAAKSYRVLCSVMKAAIADGAITVTPCQVSGGTKEAPPDLVILEPADVRAIADLMPARFQALIYVLGFVGLRLGEALALRSHHFDAANGVLLVREQVTEVNGVIRVGPLKTAASRRDVVLGAALTRMLVQHQWDPRATWRWRSAVPFDDRHLPGENYPAPPLRPGPAAARAPESQAPRPPTHGEHARGGLWRRTSGSDGTARPLRHHHVLALQQPAERTPACGSGRCGALVEQYLD